MMTKNNIKHLFILMTKSFLTKHLVDNNFFLFCVMDEHAWCDPNWNQDSYDNAEHREYNFTLKLLYLCHSTSLLVILY